MLDTRREALSPDAVRGHPALDGLHLAAPNTPSTTTQQSVNITQGVAVIPPKVQQSARQVDFDCGTATLVDGKSLPVAVVAYYSPAMASILFLAIAGTSHATPADPADSRSSYPTDTAIEAALPADVADDMYTVIGVEVFARSGSTVTQLHDEGPRSWGVDTADKYGAGDDFTLENPAEGASKLISGTATILNGQTSVTVTAATLGGAFGGKPVQLTMAEAPTASLRLWHTWSGNDLVITTNQDNTATLAVSYLVDAR